MFVIQLCPTLYDPMDCSPPDSSVHGILQARILERVAISFSRERNYTAIKIHLKILFFYLKTTGSQYCYHSLDLVELSSKSGLLSSTKRSLTPVSFLPVSGTVATWVLQSSKEHTVSVLTEKFISLKESVCLSELRGPRTSAYCVQSGALEIPRIHMVS